MSNAAMKTSNAPGNTKIVFELREAGRVILVGKNRQRASPQQEDEVKNAEKPHLQDHAVERETKTEPRIPHSETNQKNNAPEDQTRHLENWRNA